MTRKALPFFLVFSLLLLAGCILIPNAELRMGLTALISFLTIMTLAILFFPSGNQDKSDPEEIE